MRWDAWYTQFLKGCVGASHFQQHSCRCFGVTWAPMSISEDLWPRLPLIPQSDHLDGLTVSRRRYMSTHSWLSPRRQQHCSLSRASLQHQTFRQEFRTEKCALLSPRCDMSVLYQCSFCRSWKVFWFYHPDEKKNGLHETIKYVWLR